MAPRPIWTGTVSFALLSVPVKLYTATRSKDISFNQIEKSTGARVKQKKVSSVTGDELAAEDIVKGYKLGGDSYVFVESEELDALAPRDAANERTIRILDFVNLSEIDPVYFEKAYYIAPERGGLRPYALLARAMQETGKVAIAKVVMHNREYLTAIRAVGNVLCMETMLFSDEVVSSSEIDGIPEAGIDIPERELDMAKMLVETSSGAFEPEKYRDEYRDRVMAMIEAKAAGQTFEVPQPDEPAKVVDLMAALEASLAAARAKKAS